MLFVHLLLAAACFLIFVMGVASFRDGSDSSIPIVTAVFLMLMVFGVVKKETVNIPNATIERAIKVCEANGGLKYLNQREIGCVNGVIIQSNSLPMPAEDPVQ